MQDFFCFLLFLGAMHAMIDAVPGLKKLMSWGGGGGGGSTPKPPIKHFSDQRGGGCELCGSKAFGIPQDIDFAYLSTSIKGVNVRLFRFRRTLTLCIVPLSRWHKGPFGSHFAQHIKRLTPFNSTSVRIVLKMLTLDYLDSEGR